MKKSKENEELWEERKKLVNEILKDYTSNVNECLKIKVNSTHSINTIIVNSKGILNFFQDFYELFHQNSSNAIT
ncbi:uncharacterized protein TA15355 [Theileria annulata]|uniref:Uncharacterized protein n=1 Tax=Theileria annulata TaxID=5874 RepID=Q4UFG3_THEAN|nr:uncharacterized protein TA15355 [Theileria annulata]CAI74153.1 hypothetical protein TA15355 [Theileria annulata]|eukprot:XP_951885.1 hypothetical protein TA15355 [Theileria annulata]